jgi:hypothetical protein
MPPKGWKKNAQPAVTGAKSPEPQVKPEKAKAKTFPAKRAVAKSTSTADAIVKEAGSPGYTAPPVSVPEKISVLNSVLLTFSSAIATQNLSADVSQALNEEILGTIDAIAELRDALLPPKIAVNTEISVAPPPEPTTQPKPPKQAAAPAQVSPPPPPMPFPAPGIQQGPLPGFVPVAR